MQKMKKWAVLMLALVLAFGCMVPAQALESSQNPLIDPWPVPHVETEDEFYNILLAGIDLGNYTGVWASGGKNVLEDCHTDVVMVVSLNKTKDTVSLVSLPRDTLTYVPGVHGVYKLNAAFNCAETAEEGMERVCDAVTWLLGGVEIHNYVAVDMAALIMLVDAIGGVDFDMDMSYVGHSGITYYQGMQHLDGVGVMDYVRARKNATVEYTDIGRTRRGRDMMMVIFETIQQKMKEDGMAVAMDLINLMFSEEFNVFTKLSMADLFSLAEMALSMENMGDIGSYVLTGDYKLALKDWNFTFTDQDNRISVLKEVYGIDAEKIPYVSWNYTNWLLEYGFPVSRQIHISRQIIEYGRQQKDLTDNQQQALAALEAQHDLTVAAFDTAADEQTIGANDALTAARTKMRKLGEEASYALGYMRDAKWNNSALWYRDPLINEYTQVDWR
ncbi:MAG: LCP family protein [Clostridia bacterium]|nr:LCP family protein [Clostridia bacterium]